MSEIDVVITEQCSSIREIIKYSGNSKNEIVQIKQRNSLSESFSLVKNFFRVVLLPYGYPESVSEDYFNYQLWDTAQAFCSSIIGAFTTRAVLKGVGVGDAQASALSAAITWIMKEGTGMIGRIIFAWWKGNGLDSDCKKWRIFADILNDVAMTIELFLPYISNFSMQVLCATSVMKSIVGIAGGATRASITHHQAIKNNMAEVSAKDGSQETLVNLLASFTSIFLLNIFSGTMSEWAFIFALMAMHILANYFAVKSLIFKTFNNQRMALVLKTYFNVGSVLNPQKVNKKEAVLLGSGLKVDFCGFNVHMGESLKNILNRYSLADFQQTLELYEDKKYIILVDIRTRQMYVSFERGETTETVVAAYFHAVCLAIATCIYNGIDLDIYSKRHLHHPTPITRLYTFMKSYEKSNIYQNIPHNHLVDFNEFVKQEYFMFYTAMEINGWSLDSHSLVMGEWRTNWKSYSKKTL
ncbi:hypothetical protein NQ314_002827 [Rhamnusium bicolor]|uniref:Uncharacterized protein n=1 Tax=Rhamnusium bicolor TaxID=1586634 RepID=A0AAV8ZQT6_9CUCU|nr:hypothetical protein NQ314_002827 [Rhamnusium bicolor]